MGVPLKLKNPTDKPIVLKSLTGGPMDDPIVKFASQIEKVKTRTEIEEFIKNLNNAVQFDRFKLGGIIAVAEELYKKAKSEFKDCKNFREYVEMVLGISYSNAMRAREIYKKLVELDIPWSAFENIGWTKVLTLLDVVTKDNVKQLVAKAKEMNHPSLKALVAAEKQKGKTDTEQGPKTITTKTFQLHADQKEVVNAALEKIKEESGTEVDTVALEYMAQNYLGAGVQFKGWDPALTYAIKHQEDRPLFIQKVVTRLEELCPDLDITVTITLKEPAATA